MQPTVDTELWKNSFGIHVSDEYSSYKTNLLSSLDIFRRNTIILSNEIARDLPNFTVHDINHIDSLWEMASLIVGKDFKLNPMEAFVLGSAILLHDLGMASAAYVNGPTKLFEGPEWNDLIEYCFKEVEGRTPTQEERDNIPVNIIDQAKALRLRELHSEHAEILTSIVWKTKEGQSHRLLEDQELLEHFGEYIGQIAASHGWPIEKVEKVLDLEIGAPPSYPNSWSVDILKLACIIRVADAAHLDSRRAPSFLRALRRPELFSDNHWKFQGKLSRPTISEDQLVYNSTQRFQQDEIDPWWLAYESLNMINDELKAVNRLLKDKKRMTFKIKGVRGVESPSKLSDTVRVQGWEPVSASLHVSNVPRLVRQLGGEGLYGKDSTVPLRELIQNAKDSILSRRFIQSRDNNWGEIKIKVGNENGTDFIEILDNGIGMTQKTLIEKLLSFGTSYWGSYSMVKEYPGLLTSDFKSTGRFGIGFYSAFMWGDKITVKTRTINEGPNETKILEFGTGLSGRPILKQCIKSELLVEPGTSIKIYIKDIDQLVESMIENLYVEEEIKDYDSHEKFLSVCRMVAPSLSVDLNVEYKNSPNQNIIRANDWETIKPEKLIMRLSGFNESNCPERIKELAENYSPLLIKIFNEDSICIGRAGVKPNDDRFSYRGSIKGSLTCGGLLVENLTGVFGLFVGDVMSASRQRGIPLASQEQIAKWATIQAQLIQKHYSHLSESALNYIAELICSIGGDVKEFPLCYTHYGWLNYSQIQTKNWDKTLGLTSYYMVKDITNLDKLEPNVITISSGILMIFPGISELWDMNRSLSLGTLIIQAFANYFKLDVTQVLKDYDNRDYKQSANMKLGTTLDGSAINSNIKIFNFFGN